MATNIFGFITAAVLACAGFLAYTNKGAYQHEEEATKQIKEEFAANEKRLERAKEELANTVAKNLEVEEQNTAVLKEEKELEARNAEVTAKINSIKNDKFTENQKKLETIKEQTAKIGGIKELASKVRASKLELEELAKNTAEAQAKVDGLTAQNNVVQRKVNTLKAKFDAVSGGRSVATLKTHIRSIYSGWGFVTLATGNSGGVVMNSTLDVTRDGEVVAKLLVTAVERNSASASIIPDSLAKDVTLSVGDSVVASAVPEKQPSTSLQQPAIETASN